VTLRVIGAGVGRTGTLSLKLALERLLGGPCHHMLEIFGHPEQIAGWHAAARGEATDWPGLLAGYRAAVDWPAAEFWPELMEAFPDAIVLLSLRDADAWWESAEATIWKAMRGPLPPEPAHLVRWRAMVEDLMQLRFGAWPDDRDATIAAFHRHNDRVRAGVPATRLVEWRAGDGWEPICAALGLAVPDETFPHRNSRTEFSARLAHAEEA
jgi:hypothetical protein